MRTVIDDCLWQNIGTAGSKNTEEQYQSFGIIIDHLFDFCRNTFG